MTHLNNTVENLIGGTANDTFKFTNGATLVGGTGRIDGYSGTADLLDYSSYTTGVTVTLEGAGTRTRQRHQC